MSPALRTILASTALFLGSTALTSPAWADSTSPELLVLFDPSCGDSTDRDRLSAELAIRLPEFSIATSTSSSQASHPWVVHWLAGDPCQVELLGPDRDTVHGPWPLQTDANDEDLQFVASRLSWVISFHGPPENAPSPAPPSPVAQAHPEPEPTSRPEAPREPDLPRPEPQPEQKLPSDDLDDSPAEALPLDVEPDPTPKPEEVRPVLSAADLLWPDVDRDEREPSQPPPMPSPEETHNAPPPLQPSEPEIPLSQRTRISLFPGITLKGADLEEPSLSLNAIGRHARFQGTEIGLINILDDQAQGFQFALLGNRVEGPVQGLQFAGLANGADALRGAQIAFTFNVVSREVVGIQLSSGFNHAHRGVGLQSASLVNHVHDEWTGLQLGILNVANQVHGAQIGLVNISRSTTAPIGLINVIVDHPPRLKLSASMPGYSYLGLETGGKSLRYSLLLASRIGPQESGAASRQILGLGLGWRFFLEDPFFIDLELAILTPAQTISELFSEMPLQQLRGTFGWRLQRRFAPIAGVGLTRMKRPEESFLSPWALPINEQVIWPELLLGILF